VSEHAKGTVLLVQTRKNMVIAQVDLVTIKPVPKPEASWVFIFGAMKIITGKKNIAWRLQSTKNNGKIIIDGKGTNEGSVGMRPGVKPANNEERYNA
jgi:hypothetical protein